jgi:transcriptional regulator with XRE-family HTH domain
MARTPKKTHPMTAVWRERFGEYIRERRKLSGHSSQDSLAEVAGLSREMVNIVETGKRDYGIDQALLLLVCAETKTREDALDLDPIGRVAMTVRGINSLSSKEIDACKVILEALNDPNRRHDAETYLGLLSRNKVKSGQRKEGAGGRGP